MEERLEERTKGAPLFRDIERDMSEAIRNVLQMYNVVGKYSFNVRKEGSEARCIRGGYLVMPFCCSGSGVITGGGDDGYY